MENHFLVKISSLDLAKVPEVNFSILWIFMDFSKNKNAEKYWKFLKEKRWLKIRCQQLPLFERKLGRGSFQRRDDTWILIDSIQGNKKSRDMIVPLKMKWEPKDSLYKKTLGWLNLNPYGGSTHGRFLIKGFYWLKIELKFDPYGGSYHLEIPVRRIWSL